MGEGISFTIHTPHYENVPFEVPDNWVWCKLEDYVKSVADGDHQAPPKSDIGIPFLVISDVAKGKLNFLNTRFVPQEYYEKISFDRKPEKGDLLFTVTGSYGIVVPVNIDDKFCFQRHIGLIKTLNTNKYLLYLLKSSYIKGQCDEFATGTAQKTVGLETLRSFLLPIPPLAEQQRIVAEIERWFSLIDIIENGKDDLQTAIKQTKSKILDLAIHGKLVPQDPNDEPAIELLKHINPDFTPCDNGHSQKLPQGWCHCSYKDLFSDISSKAYQILQTEIQNNGIYPVVSQSANYIEGYTDTNNVFQHEIPCIIFGDHTRNVKYVDFDFVAGADGVKILCPKVDAKWSFYIIMYASSHIENKGYSRHFGQIVKFRYMLPPLAEQQRIVQKIEELFSSLDNIQTALEV